MSEADKRGLMQTGPIKLLEVLQSLAKGELEALAERVGARIDRNKRVEPAVQVARVLVALPEVRDLGLFPPGEAQLLRRLAEAGGMLNVSSVPPALDLLASRGLVFARMIAREHYELVLPAAYLLQFTVWEGEDSKGMRALLSCASIETQSAIVTHYTGRPATHPVVLGLEIAWDFLHSMAAVAEQVRSLAHGEKRLLEAICKEGGEIDTEELLDLEREPLRLRGATGATPTRRGVGYALERRGMLIPLPPNRYVVPTPVLELVEAEETSLRKVKREQIRAFVLDGDHEPRRARFALDPTPLVMALAMAARETGAEVRENAGTPRSLLSRLAQRFGREPQAVALLVTLSRAMGLWEASALSKVTPPGSLTPVELGRALFRLWRQGGAWDEARVEPEVLRLPVEARDSSPVRILREIVIDALIDLGESRWVPFEAMADYVRNDPRTPSVSRLLRRWAARAGLETPTATEIAQIIVYESLPALGMIDLGQTEFDEEQGEQAGFSLVRITPRGRGMLQDEGGDVEPVATQFVDDTLLRIGNDAPVGAILSLFPFVEVGKVADVLELDVSHPAISRAVASGMEGELIKTTLGALVKPSKAIARALDQLTVVLGRVTYVSVSGFLWCEDPDIREMLRSRKQTAELFVDPSPQGGLLLAPTVQIDTLVRRCRALGVEVVQEGQVLRTRSTIPPAMLDGKPRSTRPPKSDKPSRRPPSNKPSKVPPSK